MAFPSKGDRVAHFEYGPGTITDLDVYHTVIDFDAHGSRRFVTSRVTLERTSDPGPSASERRAAAAQRARDAKPKKAKTVKASKSAKSAASAAASPAAEAVND